MTFEAQRLEKSSNQQTRAESKTRLVEQVHTYLRSGEYSRALDSLRGAAAEFPSDAELSDLEKRAQDGIQRNAEANRLITESQDLFAQQKSAEAIQLLRKAYELDKHNSLARAILANALVEHAHSLVETDWLEAETLTNQALALNPAHPTAKTIHNLIVEQKKTSSVDDWVTQARKRQSAGDLFAALAWVAEGLAVHPDDPKLVQIHDAIQRDQAARRRQARRGDLDDLRRMEHEIDSADEATKQALAKRIQGVAAKHWTDGEILSLANGLLQRLGLVPQDGTSAQKRKSTAVIFHVPRQNATDAPSTKGSQAPTLPVVPGGNLPGETLSGKDPAEVTVPDAAATGAVSPDTVSPGAAPPSAVASTSPEPQVAPPAAVMPTVEPSASAAKVSDDFTADRKDDVVAISNADHPLRRSDPAGRGNFLFRGKAFHSTGSENSHGGSQCLRPCGLRARRRLLQQFLLQRHLSRRSPLPQRPRTNNERAKQFRQLRKFLPTAPLKKSLLRLSRPPSPRITLATWGRSLWLPAKTTQKCFSTANFNRS